MFLARSAPHGRSAARALTDMMLSAAVFEQDVRIVFIDDGVGQLLAGQNPTALGVKNTSAALTAFELYGIEQVYVLQDSLTERRLDSHPLLIDVERCDNTCLKELVAQADHVFTA